MRWSTAIVGFDNAAADLSWAVVPVPRRNSTAADRAVVNFRAERVSINERRERGIGNNHRHLPATITTKHTTRSQWSRSWRCLPTPGLGRWRGPCGLAVAPILYEIV